MCYHARRRPLTCKAVEKQKRVPNAIKNSSRLVTGAAASQIIHFLLAGLALAACSKVLLIKYTNSMVKATFGSGKKSC